MKGGSIKYFDWQFINLTLFECIFCIFSKLVVGIFLKGLKVINMVRLVGELEDIIVLIGFDEGLLFFFRGLFHYVSLVKID